MNLELRIVIGIVALILIVGIGIYILFIRSKQKAKTQKTSPKVNVDWILELIGKDNITAIEQVQKRVRITVSDLSKVNLDGLKEQTNGVFLKGSMMVVTFKNNTEQIVESLKGVMK